MPARPDTERVRCLLAEAFVQHINALWERPGLARWIRANVDSLLATIERLYAMALGGDLPGSADFVDRMAWPPVLLVEIAQQVPRRPIAAAAPETSIIVGFE